MRTSARHSVVASACTTGDITADSSGTATSAGFQYSISVPAQLNATRKPTAGVLSFEVNCRYIVRPVEVISVGVVLPLNSANRGASDEGPS